MVESIDVHVAALTRRRRLRAFSVHQSIHRPAPTSTMSLQRATAHDWANIFAWLADPSDARWTRALRAACRLGLDGFDTAVHAGWITLAAHDRSAPEEEGATCLWVRGWIPVDFNGCGGRIAEGEKAFAVRLEHRLANAAAMTRWACPMVIVCETLQPRRCDDALSTAVLAACVPAAVRFILSRTTVRVPDKAFAMNPTLTSFDTTGLTALTTVGDNWFSRCSSLTSVDTTGLTSLTSVGDDWFFDCSSLTSVDTTGLTAVAARSLRSWLAAAHRA
jgi:hypothetical protein